MRPIPRILSVSACVSLVALQLSGMHMHVDEHGYVGVPEAAHSHSHAVQHTDGLEHVESAPAGPRGDQSQHDYDGATDVSVMELSNGASKLLSMLICLAFVLSISLVQSARSTPVVVVSVLSGRRTRWRPPLRAPPHFS